MLRAVAPVSAFNRGVFCLLALFGVGLVSAAPVPTNMMPIAVTGWNRDVVVEASAIGPPFTSYAAEMNAGENRAHYQTGLPTYAWGLPPSGGFASMVGDGTIFQFQPYTADNSLVLSPDTGLTSGTLTLTAPATYARLAVLAHSGNGTNTTGALTVNFSDGSTFTTVYYAPDWFNNTTNVAWFGSARVNLSTGADDGGTQNPRFYQTSINLATLLGASNKPIASLTFGKAIAKSTAVYAVSGQLSASGGPISVAGWNRDVVIENTASGLPYTSYAAEFNPGEGTAFYQNGLPGTTNGLPRNGTFQSAADGMVFQFQPFTANNALVMSSETGTNRGTLTLTTPASYNAISVIANSAGGGGSPNWTLKFADGSTLVTNYYAPDWFNNNPYALSGTERINLASGALYGLPDNPRFYQTSLDLVAIFGATNKTLTSLTFDQAAGAGTTAVYALSGVAAGQTNGGIAVPAITNLPAVAIQTRAATLPGTVLSTGGDAPEVLIYYGPSDAGTNAAAWAQRVFLGAQANSFAQTVSGLSPATTYYFSAAAINSAGTVWATGSRSFTTAPALLPIVTNLPAANIFTNSALLSGQVLSTGGDAPTITLYYGPSSGGINPAAWAHSALLGTQVGRFAQSIAGLSPSATWYFTARALNVAGAGWALPVQSFTTPATNPPTSPLVSVLTYRNDNTRGALNTNETTLTLSNVNTNTFGKLFSYGLDGYMPSQPLVMPNVNIPGQGVHNVVFAATEHDSVYAFDADGTAGAAPLWQTSFINPAGGIYTLNNVSDLVNAAAGFVGPELGISGTPVIDPVSGTLYVVSMTKEVVNSVTNFYNRLHALDVRTGAEKFGGPVLIQGSVAGVGDGNDGAGHVPFVQLKHHQRPALLLLNGNVYIAFTGHFDYPPYHGWVFGYNAYTLAQTGLFNSCPNGSGSGFWQAACGPAADALGNLYLESGNGNFDAAHNNFGDSVLKLSTANGLALADYFTPYNQLNMNLTDLDLGSAGQIVLPDSAGSLAHPHLLLAGSKAGTIYLLDRDNLGQFNSAGDSQIVQSVNGAVRGMWCTPAWFNGMFYYIANGDRLKAFSLSNAVINATPLSQGTLSFGSSSPSISANGASNAIVWANDASGGSGNPLVLRAFNATNVAQELYNSSLLPARDNPGNVVKWSVPTIANGKVYVSTANTLSIFGNSSFLNPPVIAPNGGTFTNSIMVTITNSSNGATVYYTLDGSAPTTNSILYTGPFVLTSSAGVRATATMPGTPNSIVTLATFISSSVIGHGAGLLGQYYPNTYSTNPFVGSPLVRTDAVVNFDWSSVPPDPSIPSTYYTVRWTGMVQPIFNETYTFSTTTDDGVRLWVNNQLVIDHWSPQSPTTWSGSIALNAGLLYPVEMDYFQAAGGAVAQLSWSSLSTAPAIVPQSQLYPITTLPPVSIISSAFLTNGVFQVQASGMAGGSYILQSTTDLVHWVSISTNIAPANLFNLLDPAAMIYPYRFYRAVEQP
jgi:hypothetical protein